MNSNNEINRIGFRRSDEIEAEKKLAKRNKKNNQVEKAEPETISTMPMTPAQGELCETIKSLAEIIVSKEFGSYADNQRELFVIQLMNSIALNAELTAKTILLAQSFGGVTEH
jgi:polysaccharide pyruvyl transferase WcaK-like protein